MTYEDMKIVADETGLIVKEKPLQSSNGRINGNKIAIRRDLPSSVHKKCVLAEELGHYQTSVGRILKQSDTENQKQELKAREWAYDHQVGLTGIIDCYKAGCQTISEMAEYLEVTEEFLREALERYRQKYGIYTSIGHYIIYFEPTLTVVRMVK